MNSFQPFQAWILSAGLHALTLIVLAGPAYEVVAGRKSTACDPPCFLHLPSPESERFFSKLAELLLKRLMSSCATHQSEDLISFLKSMFTGVLILRKNVADGKFYGEKLLDIFPDSALLLLLLLISNTALLSSQLTLFTVTASPSALCHCK